ncbi:MAG: ATP-dependent DNA ligase [Candidatus Daviesbacteria bacterium]|nr:ATP-dependent DNA ligase [Candidatus Daviesbacteria bacterium]
MTFATLSKYFEKLEETSSRLTLIEILAKLFDEVKTDEIAEVCYLLQGRVAPFYEATEIGMSEKLVAASIARAYGVKREEVLKEFGRVGDLGLVAEKLAQSHSGVKRSEAIESQRSYRPMASRMTVEEVFKTLREIAKLTGNGTVEKKVVSLSGLLGKVDGVSAKHLVRIPLGASRLGIGDPTVLDGFAASKLGDRKKRKELEGAYNRTSDLGLIGETLWKSGLKAVQNLDVTVGRPIRSQLAERLPNAKTILEKMGGKAHVQYKYDGFRVQIHLDRTGSSLRAKRSNLINNEIATLPLESRLDFLPPRDDKTVVRLFSRNLEETTLMFPDIIEGVKKQIKAKSIILDSEALAYSPESEEFLPFQETTKRRRKYGIEEMSKKLPLKAFVFDIMYLDGKSLMDLPLEARMKKLDEVLISPKGNQGSAEQVLIPQPGEITDSADRIQTMFDDALTKGLEGLIVKRPDSKYEAGGRNFNWVKLKRHSSGELKDTIDCVILGYIYGKGKRAEFGAGALLVGVYDKDKDEFVTVSKIGTGLTDEEWREIHKRADKIKVAHKPARVNSIMTPSVWIAPEIVIEVLADEITRSPNHTAGKTETEAGYALRFPRLVKFREADKRAEDSTTVSELIHMYKDQFKR